MNDAPEILLAHHLKALMLPTFLREHQKLARQCATEGLDHVRYLARLVELELIDRERRMCFLQTPPYQSAQTALMKERFAAAWGALRMRDSSSERVQRTGNACRRGLSGGALLLLD